MSRWTLVAVIAGVVAGAVEVATAVDAVTVAVGLGALAGAAATLRSAPVGGAVLAVAGAGSLQLDVIGSAPPPRLLPGALLLLAAAVALGAATRADPASRAARALVVVGLSAHAVLGLPLAVLGLAIPGPAVLGLLLLWSALLAVALRGRRRRPWLVPAAPVVMALLAVVVVTAGGELLGWSA